MNWASKGALEAEIANCVTKFHREQQGRGPQSVRAWVVAEMIVVRCNGIWTPIESKLCGSEEGRKLIKSARDELRQLNHLEIENLLAQLCQTPVLRSYFDLSVENSELVEIYVLGANLEKTWRAKANKACERRCPARKISGTTFSSVCL